jgi:hypothetical protein
MIAGEVFLDIVFYHRQGYMLCAISRKLGIHRDTVARPTESVMSGQELRLDIFFDLYNILYRR